MKRAIELILNMGLFFDEIILIMDSEKNIYFCNDVAKRYFGTEEGRFHHNFVDYCAQKDSPISSFVEDLTTEPAFASKQCRIISTSAESEKQIIDWKIVTIPSELADGSPVFLLGGKDISGECIKNDKIDDLEIQLNSVIEIMSGNYWWKDLQGVYKGFNQSLLNLLGVRREDIIGKTDHDLPWAETADELVRNDRLVFLSGQPYKTEEEVKSADGEVRTFDIFKIPLKNRKGEIVGVIGNSIDITERKKAVAMEKIKTEEAMRLKIELEHQKALVQEKEKFVMIANKVAHDINSPLATLKMMMAMSTELPEEKRTVFNKAIGSMLDIVNNLLLTYRKQESQLISDTEQRQSLLISDFLAQLLSEKKIQYSDRSVRFELNIDQDAQFSFAQMQPSQFRRTVSNLINNAVDAMDSQHDGVVTIKLTADANFIAVSIQDNGKGMSASMIEKMLNRQSFTEGKHNGHGIGLQQVWDTVDNNQGTMTVTSAIDVGTAIQLTFPRSESAHWIAEHIQFAQNSIIVILDDDESIHGAWEARFSSYLASHPTVRTHHFTHGDATIDFINTLNLQERDRTIFLSDYELLKQAKNGLQIIEMCGIKNSTLVTSYYDNEKVKDKATQLGVKILPKKMASVVPINFSQL